MPKRNRKPISNFIIKPDLQSKIIVRILVVMILTGIITSGLLALFYNYKSSVGNFYFLSNDVRSDLELSSILGVILPSLLIAQGVSFLIAFAIGLFSSRKAAVPVYKIEKWVDELSKGNLNTQLVFRENDGYTDLSEGCNNATNLYRLVLQDVKDAVHTIDSVDNSPQKIKDEVLRINEALAKLEF